MDGLATDATLTIANPIDLTAYGSVELTFDWYIESTLDAGDYLAVDLFDGTTWTEAARLEGDVDAEDVWHQPYVQIPADHLVEDFQFRFRANMNDFDEVANVDNVQLVATSMDHTNLPPVAADDVIATAIDTAVVINVLDNDSDPDGDALTILSVGSATNGTVLDNGDGTLTYTPSPGYVGQVATNYTINDGLADSTATVIVKVGTPADAYIDFNDYTILSYGGAASDVEGTATVEAEGAVLHLVGNLMKAIDLSHTVTPDTVLEFDFFSGHEGESHAIGFDTDEELSLERLFQLYGSDTTGLQSYRIDNAGDGFQHFTIPVGQYYTGEMTRLVLANDDDANALGQSVFANLHIFENVLSVNVDGSSQSFSVEGFGNQDALATTMIVEDNGDTLRMAGNTWKKLDLNYTITPNTMLEFDFASSQQGEVHALGFDTNDSASGQRMFQLYGSDTWGIQAYRDYDPGHGTQHFVIPVGEFFTGTFDRLVLANDDDANALGQSVFANLHIFENVLSVNVDGSSQSFSVESFGNQDVLATTMIVEDNGDTLRMAGNTWKKLNLSYTITPNTMLEFDFASSQQGEVHALGFDTDDSASGQRMFQLYGSDTWGIQAYRDYDPGHGTQHFVIPVGDSSQVRSTAWCWPTMTMPTRWARACLPTSIFLKTCCR